MQRVFFLFIIKNEVKVMFKFFKKEEIDNKLTEAVSKKLRLDTKEFDLVAYDKFFGSFIFLLAVSNKKVHVYSSDDKKNILEFNISEFDNISIQKKIDMNLYLKNGKFINLTTAVGVKPKVVNQVRALNEEINRLR